MICTICMESDVILDDIKVLECGHLLCCVCYQKLIRNKCPFCRNPISNKVDGHYNIDDSHLNIYYINDDIQETHQYETVNVLYNSELDMYDYIPNYPKKKYIKKKKRRNKKKGFTSNKNRFYYQRRKKKFKKGRNHYINAY